MTRDPLRWPFAATSIWNTPIGSGAVYVAAGIKQTTGNGMTVDQDLIDMHPEAPALAVMTNTADWNNTLDRCPASQPTLFSVPLPADFVFKPTLPDTPNAAFAGLLADGRTIKQTQPLSRCTAGAPATSHYVSADVDILGDGITGAHGGSGLSSIGGTLRIGELRPGGAPVRHALKVELFAADDYWACQTYADCYRWPAIQGDSAAVGYYGGSVRALRPGALLALPATLDPSTLGLETTPAQALAWTLQNYGAYVVDDTAWSVYALCVEWGPDGDFTQQFLSDWGFSATPSSKNTPWARDMDRLFAALAVVDDNAAGAVGGAGTALQPPAPPFAP